MIPTRDRNMSGKFTVTVFYNITRCNKCICWLKWCVCSNDNARYEQYKTKQPVNYTFMVLHTRRKKQRILKSMVARTSQI
jgi:hypothetical protein